MTRTFAVHDAVAIRDRVGQPWQLGTVTGHTADGWLIIDRGHRTIDIRHPDDVRVIPADQVPAGEQHWVPQTVRDQLVRQEAAGRLRAMAVALDHDRGLLELANLMDDLVGPGGGGWLLTGGWVGTAELLRAARALLAPAPQPASTEATR